MGILNIDAVRQAKDRMESQNGSSSIGFAKLNQGRNVMRVLWPKGDKKLFYVEGFVHYGLGENGKGMATCPKTFDEHKRCPICEYSEQLQKSKDKNDQNVGSGLRRRKRVYLNVIDRDDKSGEGDVPKVLPVGVTVLKPLLDFICDPDYGDITHPTQGRDLTITKKGQGLKTEYAVVVKPNTTPVSETVSPEEIENQMADLDSLFKELTPNELEAMINDEDSGDDEEIPEKSGGTANNSTDNSGEYDDMDVDELKALCEKREIPLPANASKFKMIMYLTQFDEEQQKDDVVLGAIKDTMELRKNR